MKSLTILTIGFLSANLAFAGSISRSFELRYVSEDKKADGETGFKGGNATFDTDDRIEYLKNYAEYAKKYFNDPALDKKVVSLEQARKRLASIKPQPVPSVRKRLQGEWKAYGFKAGKRAASLTRISYFNKMDGASVEGGILRIKSGTTLPLGFTKQSWRMHISWKALINLDTRFTFDLGGVATISSADLRSQSGWTHFKIELDIANQRYNAYVNDELLKDFVVFVNKTENVSQFGIQAGSSLQIDDIHAVGFTKDFTNGTRDLHSRDKPFLINTILDDDFEAAPTVENWVRADYDDSQWDSVELPYAHGGERYRDEALYLRKSFHIPASERVAISVECLDPSGELWVNGQPVFISHNRHPIELDITRYVKFGEANIIAVKVDPYEARKTMRHTSADQYIGWFSGRIHLDCTTDTHVKDLFVITDTIGDQAKLRAEVWIKKVETKTSNEREIKKLQAFNGELKLKLYKWFPTEGEKPVAEAKQKIMIRDGKVQKLSIALTVNKPELWSPEDCHLYKLHAEIYDSKKKLIDDYVVTTGIRTVGQEGGTFRINGKAAMMNGALLFSMPAPIGIIAQWQRSAPGEYIIKDLMQLKAMNGNTARMSQHHGPALSINDPRYAEYGDQLGIIFQWATTSWVRTTSPWQLDFEGLAMYVRQVRNHPSIVMWQPANHPKFINFEESMEWFQKVYDTVWPEDDTRLICPTSNLGRLGELRTDDGRRKGKGEDSIMKTWVLPGLTRGSMEHMTGYGRDSKNLIKWPAAKKTVSEQNWGMGEFRVNYLASKDRAFFDFESEESASQPNWSLRKGKPGYEVMSYEWGYDKGSIGQYLEVDQWQESQAWQAFSGFEAYKKKRWLDYDGLAWCCLRGGGNSGTYKKPLIDYYDHAKLGFYTIRMVYQPVLACSKNVDVVYGPSDSVPIVVMNLGEQKKVDVTVEVKTLSGEIVHTHTFSNVILPEGRSFTDLNMSIKGKLKPGFHAFEYQVNEK